MPVEPTRFPPLPRFAAEHFGTLVLEDTRAKQFDDGVLQLEEEGLMQVLFPREGRRAPILGVVGALQFEIVVARMAGEYGVKCRVDPLRYSSARRVVAVDSAAPGPIKTPPGGYISTVDRQNRLCPAVLLDMGAGLLHPRESARSVRRADMRLSGDAFLHLQPETQVHLTASTML